VRSASSRDPIKTADAEQGEPASFFNRPNPRTTAARPR
jgi:hypothetical protein